MVSSDQFTLDIRVCVNLDRLFFALRPDDEAAQSALRQAERLCREHGLSARPCAPERLHVSLASAESARGRRKGDAETALRIADDIELKPFSVDFDRIRTFHCGDRNAIVLRCRRGAADISALRRKLRHLLTKAGFRNGPDRFSPHLTLLWTKCRIPDLCLDRPIGWTVRDFVLVRSLFGRSRHIDLGRWALGTQASKA